MTYNQKEHKSICLRGDVMTEKLTKDDIGATVSRIDVRWKKARDILKILRIAMFGAFFSMFALLFSMATYGDYSISRNAIMQTTVYWAIIFITAHVSIFFITVDPKIGGNK